MTLPRSSSKTRSRMDSRQTKRFLDRLYDEGDQIEVAFIQPGGKVARRERAYTPEALPSVLDEMERAETAGFNVYVSVLPVAIRKAERYDRVWVDQDDPAAPWPFGADDRWEGASWPMPTTLIKTSDAEGGFRWQAIWRLTKDLDQETGRAVIKRLAARVGGDGSVHDLRRVLRVPGLINAKRGSLARIIDTTTGTISLEAFDLPTETAMEKLLTMPISNPAAVLGEWLEGVEEGDRSRKAYVCARFLKSCEVLWQDAGAIMQLGASRAIPPFPEHELEHALNSAYHRQD